MVEAPAPTVDNVTLVLRSQTTQQETGSKIIQLIVLVPVNLQPPAICFKCHLFGVRCYLSTTTTGPFVPASRDTKKTKAPPPPGSPAHPITQTGTNTGLPPLTARDPNLSCPGPIRASVSPLRGTGISLHFHPLTQGCYGWTNNLFPQSDSIIFCISLFQLFYQREVFLICA